MRPLEDVRILALEQFGAGPFATLHLADLGAEVIKIEDPSSGGDVGRYVPPHAEGEDSLFFETFNRNKRSISLDISMTSGRKVFEDLVAVSDAVFANVRGDVPARIKIRYEDLAPINPRIVCCLLSGFGMTGPHQADPAYDYILQGIAGWMDVTGEPDGPPTKAGLSLVDYSGGIVAALALVAGLHAARRDGVGCDCDISLFDTALSLLTYPATWALSAGFQPRRTHNSAHPSLVPFQNFPTRDGWIVIACPKEKFWGRLANALDRGDLETDPRFSSFATRYENRGELLAILEGILRTESTEHWLDRLTEARVPCGPVNTIDQALAHPQTLAREMIIETDHPRFGTVRQLASPVRVGKPSSGHRRAPQRGEDLSHVLAELLGYDAARVAELERGGAFGVEVAAIAVQS